MKNEKLVFYNLNEIAFIIADQYDQLIYFSNGDELKIIKHSNEKLNSLAKQEFINVEENCFINPKQIRTIKNDHNTCIIKTTKGVVYNINIKYKKVIQSIIPIV